MIRFHNVYKCYRRGEDVLNDVSFDMHAGEMAFLIGHSGAGKTTLLKLIAAIEPINKGQIIISGKNLKNLHHNETAKLRRSIGIVLQDPMLLENRTVFDNVALPLTIANFKPREIKRRVGAALDMVNLTNKSLRHPAALSAGEKQRVSIARAIVARPSILLADEPTGNLDPDLAKEILDLFTKFNNSGVTVLVATHNLALIEEMPYRILTLKDGELIQ